MRWIALGAVCALMVGLAGCDNYNNTADKDDAARVDKQAQVYNDSQPIPFFDYSLERDVAIQLYEARNEKVRTWTVWRSDYGLIEGYTESIGYPIPYDVQLTNPLKPTWTYNHSSVAVEQQEPNGLFSSHNSIATWIRAVIRDGEKTMEVPIYVEGKVTCYPYPIKVDLEKNQVTMLRPESDVIIKTKK